jgi:acetyl esterase/lipase
MKKNHIRSIPVLIPIFLLCVFCKNKEEAMPDLPAAEYTNIIYGPYPRNTMDVSLPGGRTPSTPVIIFLHGGSWIAGSKEDMSGFRKTFSSLGFAAASINYRYVNGEVTYRQQLEDIGAAIKYIVSRSSAWNISGRTGLVGYSAGAHLGLLYAYNNPGTVRAVTSMAGPTDFTDPYFMQYMLNINPDAFDILIGPVYRSDSSGELRKASPLFALRDIPTQLFYGQQDQVVPVSQGKALYDSLRSRKLRCEISVFHDAGHIIFGDHYQHADSVNNGILRWMRTHL